MIYGVFELFHLALFLHKLRKGIDRLFALLDCILAGMSVISLYITVTFERAGSLDQASEEVMHEIIGDQHMDILTGSTQHNLAIGLMIMEIIKVFVHFP
jgi:hypothetical protein